MGEGSPTREWVIRDSEEKTVGVLQGLELFLDLLDKTFGGVIPVGDGYREEVELPRIIRSIQTEHRILFGSGKGVEAIGDFH